MCWKLKVPLTAELSFTAADIVVTEDSVLVVGVDGSSVAVYCTWIEFCKQVYKFGYGIDYIHNIITTLEYPIDLYSGLSDFEIIFEGFEWYIEYADDYYDSEFISGYKVTAPQLPSLSEFILTAANKAAEVLINLSRWYATTF